MILKHKGKADCCLKSHAVPLLINKLLKCTFDNRTIYARSIIYSKVTIMLKDYIAIECNFIETPKKRISLQLHPIAAVKTHSVGLLLSHILNKILRYICDISRHFHIIKKSS